MQIYLIYRFFKTLVDYSVFCFFIFIVPSLTFAQKNKLVNYDELFFSDNFDNNRKNWLNVNNSENFFLIKDGYFHLQRRNQKVHDIVICPYSNDINAFQLSAKLKMETFTPKISFMGLLFNAGKDGLSAVAFEVNTSKEYRIKKLAGTSWIILTTQNSIQGWIHTNALQSPGDMIEIMVRTKNEDFDFYINGQFIQTLHISGITSGDFGFVVGPSTKVGVDEVAVMATTASLSETTNPTTKNQINNDLINKNKTQKDLSTMSQQNTRVMELEEETNLLQKRNDQLERENDAYKKNKDLSKITELNETIERLQQELSKVIRTNEEETSTGNRQPATGLDTPSEYDKSLYERYAKLVKENIALKTELENVKSGNSGTTTYVSPDTPTGATPQNQSAFLERIKQLEDQLKMANELNLKLMKMKNTSSSETSSEVNSYHIVKKGETLYSISKLYQGLTPEKIRNMNNLRGNELSVGGRIRVK